MRNGITLFRAEQGAAEPEEQSFSAAIPQSIRLTCLFGAFVFLQFTVLGLANHAGEGYLTTAQRDGVYYALQAFVILGYLLHSIFERFCSEEHTRRMIAYGVFGLFFFCVTLMLASKTDSLLSIIVSMAAVLCLGGIGGAAHCRMSMETARGADAAKSMGVGSAAAVVLQYLLQIRRGVTPALPVFMSGAFFLLCFLLPQSYTEAVPVESGIHEKTPSRRLIFTILIASAFILFTCFYNETIHHLMIQSDYASYNVYSWPRLTLLPGYLLFAVIGDRKKGKYVPIAALCIMLITLLNVVLIDDSETYRLSMCLFYFAIAAFTSYYLLTFWRLAQGTKHPAFWAPFGRVLDSSMVLFTGAIHLSTLPGMVVLGMDIVGTAIVIVLMAVNEDFNLTGAEAATVPDTSVVIRAYPDRDASEVMRKAPLRLSPDDTLARMQELYQLTPREVDVLRELVVTEDTQGTISNRLSIQVKTLQSYVTRLYRKTGASTRAGLTDLYHECRNG